MTVQQYAKVLREQWILVSIAVVVGLVGAAGAFFLRPPEYTAKLTMYVSAQVADTTQAAFQGAQLSQDRVASYTELLTSTRVTSDIVQKLGLQETPDELASKMTATSKLDSVLLDITVTDQSPQRAASIVNAVGDTFPDLVAELEKPTTVGAVPAVAVRVVQKAAVPDKPSSTSLPASLVIGLAAGLIVGALGAVIRSALDASVKTLEELRKITGAPTLGVIEFDSEIPKRPLTVHESPHSPRAEAFRQMRTNLQFIDVDRPSKVIVITSAVPGEGKTTTLANLAIALTSAGQRVVVIEADLRRPKLSEAFGIDRAVGLTSVLSGKVRLNQAIQSWAGGFDVLASGQLPPNPSELLASQQMRRTIEELRLIYDVVLIDTPPLLPVTDAAAIAPATDGVVLICRFKTTTREQLARSSEALAAVSATVLGTVFTMVPKSGSRAYAQYNSHYLPVAEGNSDQEQASKGSRHR